MRTLVLPLFVLLAGFAIQDSPVKIAWTPTVGEKLKYRITNHHPEMVVSWVDETTIRKVEKGKVTLGHNPGPPTVTKDGKPIDVNIGLSDNDDQLGVDGSDGDENRPHELEITLMGGFRYPDKELKPGETWTKAISGNANRAKATASCTVAGAETVGGQECHKLDYEFAVAEGGPSAKGTIWLRKKDGSLQKRVTQLRGVDFGGGPEDTKQEVERVP